MMGYSLGFRWRKNWRTPWGCRKAGVPNCLLCLLRHAVDRGRGVEWLSIFIEMGIGKGCSGLSIKVCHLILQELFNICWELS